MKHLVYKADSSNNEDEIEDEEDYKWDYDHDSADKPGLTKEQILSLTRDWNGREDPDKYPTHGFFPVWGAALLILACNFHYLSQT